MRLDAFDYHLPPERIAQEPLPDRSSSRLMVVDRVSGEVEHKVFRDVLSHFSANDILVVNRSRVVPARLFARRPSGGRVELFVLRVLGERGLVALGSPLRKFKPGEHLRFEGGDASCRVVRREGERAVVVEVNPPHRPGDVMERYGHVPLPPYIKRGDHDGDRVRYQTVFADADGSVAAPTAGLHFDDALLERFRERGVEVHRVTLHVGPGTFLPLNDDEVERNTLHAEHYEVSPETWRAIAAAKRDGKRLIAVGTTCTRVLETIWRRARAGVPGEAGGDREYLRGETDLFIYPGFEFEAIDGLITNFHLPRSSLLLLVCAFLGAERTLACYRTAVESGYRFFSYGDAMFIAPGSSR